MMELRVLAETVTEAEEVGPKRRGPRGSRPNVIILAALTLFRQNSFAGTSIKEIGLAAGVSAPALYRHFASKDELLAAAFEYGASRVGHAASEALALGGDARAQLTALCRSLARVAVEEPDILAVISLERRNLQPEMAVRMRRHDRLYREDYVHLLSILQPGINEMAAGTRVRAAIYAAVSASMEEPLQPQEALIDTLSEAMLGALLGGPRAV